MSDLEDVLAQSSLFEPLRPDEIARVAARFQVEILASGDTRAFEATRAAARMLVSVRGSVAIEVDSPAGPLASVLEPGDRYGEIALLTGCMRRVTATAAHARSACIATLDREGLQTVLAEFPAVALPLCSELASELRSQQDVARQLLELHGENLPPEELRAAVTERRIALARRGARVARVSPRALFRRLVTERGGEPPFWMLAGFLASLGLARLTVFVILHFHLQGQLFALVKTSGDPNPMHVHHFNYGLVLVAVSGLGALRPFGRRALRVLSLAFGCGCGLVFDEFALFWNLNPEYSQRASLLAAAVAAALLVQLTYFRRFWGALVRRVWHGALGAR